MKRRGKGEGDYKCDYDSGASSPDVTPTLEFMSKSFTNFWENRVEGIKTRIVDTNESQPFGVV